jgi:NAD+---dinitrogen-reductase ADP-D-ribosyltransferase
MAGERDHGGSFNLCNLPPWAIASRHFAADPQPIEVQGVREANRFLFQMLDGIADPEERARRFDSYVTVKFQLHQWQREETDTARRSLKNSYLRFLRGWGVDSSSIEGAVLKGWVESRMGLPPTYHRARIDGPDSEAYQRYALDRVRGHARTNAIASQLDLLYTFTQYELGRRRPGERWLTLWRGVHDAAEHEVLERASRRDWLVRMNNLSSFTDDRERAWEFGSNVFEAQVPAPRIFFESDLLPHSILKGEREVLVIGGELRVKVLVG